MPHIHDDLDFCAEVFIVYKDKLLLRKHDKYGIWLGVGGHVEHGEDPAAAAKRETREEVGLDVELFDPRAPSHLASESARILPAPAYMHAHPVSEVHRHVVFVYFGRAKTDQLKLSTTEVSEECRWVGMSDLDGMDLKPIIRFYAQQALKALTSRQEPLSS